MNVVKDFKIIFPSGYGETDELMDNIDINIVLRNGYVYFATAFTLQNIKYLMDKNGDSGFWGTDMFIAKNLTKATLRAAVAELVTGDYITIAFTQINTINEQYPGKTFDELPDMADGFEVNR